MSGVRQYILSVVCCSIVCSIVVSLTGKKSHIAPIIKLMCGILMCLTVISPIRRISLEDMFSRFPDLSGEGLAAAAMGVDASEESIRDIIIQETQAYILDKAHSLDLDLQIELELNSDRIPWEIYVSCTPTPWQKLQMQTILYEELGIPKERQIWIESSTSVSSTGMES